MTARRPGDLIDMAAATLPRHEAQRLLMTATGRSRQNLLRDPVDSAAVERFEVLRERRVVGEPLQYLEGTVQFGQLELAIDERALVPRPETEQLWELAVGLVDHPRVVVDLCTGSGNLALALKHSFPDAEVHGCDASAAALELATENSASTRLDVAWWEGDLFSALPSALHGSIDLLVSNPPYVSETEFPTLPVDVRDHEPRLALVAGPLGSEVISAIGSQAGEWLQPRGVVVCEIGELQAQTALAAFDGLHPEIRQDLADRNRFVVAGRSAG